MRQNQWYHFGVGAPPNLSGNWDVHRGHRVLTHSHLGSAQAGQPLDDCAFEAAKEAARTAEARTWGLRRGIASRNGDGRRQQASTKKLS